MGALENIVSVTISRATKTVTQAGFGVPLVAGQHSVFPERIKFFSSIEEVSDEGFTTSDAEYVMANALFAQDIKPSLIAIGRLTAPVAQVVTITPTVVNSFAYQVTINGTLHTFTSDSDVTDAEIVAGLIAAINGGAQAAKVTASGTTTLIVTSDNAGEAFTYSVGTNLSAVLTTANNGISEDLDAIVDESDDWYCLLIEGRTDLEIRLAAAKIQGMRKILLACSDAAAIKQNVSTDIGSVLNAAAYSRTALLFSGSQAQFPEAAWAGRCLPLDPGSETWKFKTLAGITADNLTSGEQAILDGKKVNYYIPVAGNNITIEGVMASGLFIDEVRGIDWLEARIKENIFSVLINAEKIPYTDAGVARIEAALRSVLESGIRVGLLASYEVTVPKVADVATLDKANRLLPDVSFSAILAGAIHSVEIRGVVSV